MATAISAKFNMNAAGEVYHKAGTLDYTLDYKNRGWTQTFSTPTEKDVDVDATIKGSSIETNLSALEAGYKGTKAEASITSFKNIILSHEDLKKGAEAMLKDEGANALEGMQKILTGEDPANMADFGKMMEDPAKRKIVADMFTAVGTSKYGMDHAVEFTRLALDAGKNPLNMGKGEKFLKYAESMNLDTKGVKESGMKSGITGLLPMLRDAFMSPDGFQTFLAKLPAMMGLAGEQLAAMQEICNAIGFGLDTCLGTRTAGVRGILNQHGDAAYKGVKNLVERVSGQRDADIAKQMHEAGTGEAVDPRSKAAIDSSKADFSKVAKDSSYDPEIEATINKFDKDQVATRTQPHAQPGMGF